MRERELRQIIRHVHAKMRRDAKNIPSSAPTQVKRVAEAWLDSARAAAERENLQNGYTGQDAKRTRDEWEGRLYVEYEDARSGTTGAWVIFDNYDRTPVVLMFYVDINVWSSMPNYGSEKPLRGGYREALAEAQTMWASAWT